MEFFQFLRAKRALNVGDKVCVRFKRGKIGREIEITGTVDAILEKEIRFGFQKKPISFERIEWIKMK